MRFLPPPTYLGTEAGLLLLQAGSLTKPTRFLMWDDEFVESYKLIESRFRIGKIYLHTGEIWLTKHLPKVRTCDVDYAKPVAVISSYNLKLLMSSLQKCSSKVLYD